MTKTNAMRILDSKGIEYTYAEYDVKDGLIDGVSVAKKVGEKPDCVFKTLVAEAADRDILVFVIPVAEELDLKKAAVAAKKKSVTMLPLKRLLPTTGYVHGGCTVFGMKSAFPVYLDETAQLFDYMTVSAGKVGMQIRLKPDDYISASGAVCAPLTKDV